MWNDVCMICSVFSKVKKSCNVYERTNVKKFLHASLPTKKFDFWTTIRAECMFRTKRNRQHEQHKQPTINQRIHTFALEMVKKSVYGKRYGYDGMEWIRLQLYEWWYGDTENNRRSNALHNPTNATHIRFNRKCTEIAVSMWWSFMNVRVALMWIHLKHLRRTESVASRIDIKTQHE